MGFSLGFWDSLGSFRILRNSLTFFTILSDFLGFLQIFLGVFLSFLGFYGILLDFLDYRIFSGIKYFFSLHISETVVISV